MYGMELIVQQSHNMENVFGPSNLPQNDEVHDSNNDRTAIKISSAPMFGLDDYNFDDVQQPLPSADFIMVLDDEESSGSQYPTLKPKPNKKKKIAVSRKEFMDLQANVDQILASFATRAPQDPDVPSPQMLFERIERLETREQMTIECILVRIEMGIRDLDNRRTAYHKDFISKAKNFITEVKKLKDVLHNTLQTQEGNSKKLI